MTRPTRPRTEEHVLGDVTATVRWIDTVGASVAVTHLPAPEGAHAHPVLLVHGNYSKRNFWVSDKGLGLGPFLQQQGFDVFIPELRGHGLSPKGPDFRRFTAEDHLRRDLPAIRTHVTSLNDRPLFLVGHSFGGLAVLGTMAAGWLSQDGVAGAVVLGANISRGDAYLKVDPLNWALCRALDLLGHFPAPKLGYGPEVEPAGEMKEIIRWKRRGTPWLTSEGFRYMDGMGGVTVPLLAYAGAADEGDPPDGCRELFDAAGSARKTFVLLGQAEGYAKDYGHVEMVVSKAAQREVWPAIARWMKERLDD